MRSRVAYFGVFTALALIFSYVETLIPFQIGIPGVKLGLANLVIVVALYKLSLKETYLLSIVRVLLSGFLQYYLQSGRRAFEPDSYGGLKAFWRL